MTEIMSKIIEMSVQAGFVILVILVVRFLFIKMNIPRRLIYVLWLIPLLRLVCPVSIATNFSLMPSQLAAIVNKTVEKMSVTGLGRFVGQANTASGTAGDIAGVMGEMSGAVVDVSGARGDISGMIGNLSGVTGDLAGTAINGPGTDGVSSGIKNLFLAVATDADITAMDILFIIWLSGIAVLAVCSVVSTLRLRKKLVGCVWETNNYYRADHIDTSFVMGIIHPKIYLPSGLCEDDREMILMHEEMHIRRKDHIVKIIVFAVTCVYWFHPLVWLMYVLFCRDMENSIDEKVISQFNLEKRKSYASLLLELSTDRKHFLAAPLAFGDGDVKGRIKNVVKYKKPLTVLVVIAAVVAVGLAVGLLTNQKALVSEPEQVQGDDDGAGYETEYYDSPFQDYSRKEDGTWQADGYTYKYRLVLSGVHSPAAMGDIFIVLSNDANITYDDAFWASGLSSYLGDYFTPDRAKIVDWRGFSLPGEEGLPIYAYTGDDQIMKAICEYMVAIDLESDSSQGTIRIPAPVILKVNASDSQDIKVWGNFWSYTYTQEGTRLITDGGGEAPGIMHLAKTDTGYNVTNFDGVGDGSDYAVDLKKRCAGQVGLYQKFMNISEEEREEIRTSLIQDYVDYNQLNIDSYQDYGWDPVFLERE